MGRRRANSKAQNKPVHSRSNPGQPVREPSNQAPRFTTMSESTEERRAQRDQARQVPRRAGLRSKLRKPTLWWAVILVGVIVNVISSPVQAAEYWVWQQTGDQLVTFLRRDEPQPTPAQAQSASPVISSGIGPLGAIRNVAVTCTTSKGHSFIEGTAIVSGIDQDQKLWLFAQSIGNPRIYPSQGPLVFENGRATSRVYIGHSSSYVLYLAIPTRADASKIEKYLADRLLDGLWGIGIEMPPQWTELDRQPVLQGC
jgi:hypothetical protein